MAGAAANHCAVCGSAAADAVSLPGVGVLCDSCLLDGRFFGAQAGLRLAPVAEKIVLLSKTAQQLIAGCVGRAEAAARAGDSEQARRLLLEQARRLRREGRQLLAVTLLLRALRLPGPSGLVYEQLALVASGMGCERDAVQYLKTASWLALKVGDGQLMERVLERLEQPQPGDGWIERARGRLAGRGKEPRCSYCGRTASQAGGLIEGQQAAVCPDCVKRLMALDGTRH